MHVRTRNSVLLMLALCLVLPHTLAAQFGVNKTDLVINRRKPAKVVVTGSDVKVEVTAQVTGGATLTDRIRSAFETDLLAADPRYKPSSSPDTVMTFSIERLDANQTAGSRQVPVTKQVCTKRVYNEKKKIYEDKPNYQTVYETQAYTIVRGDILIAMRVRDARTNEVLHTDTLTTTFNKEYPANTAPPDRTQVEQMLISTALKQGVSAVAPTREPVKVLLARPNDAIESLNKMGEAGLWSRMLEQLEAMKPLSDRKKEAYRLHNIAVAKEAVAYETADVATARKLLDEAASLFAQALQMKPDEKYFRDPQPRIAESIAAYKQLQEQQEIIAQAEVARARQSDRRAAPANTSRAVTPAPVKGAAAAAPSAARSSASSSAMSNRDVIDLVASGIDEANLIATINDAKEVAFDLSPAALKELLGAKVSNRAISAMRTRQAKK